MSFDLLGIFGAGLATFVTPCVLPLIPIYLAALLGGSLEQANRGRRGQLVGRAALFAVGFILVFTALGLVASSLGAALIRHKVVLQLGGAVLIGTFGLRFLGLIRIPWLDRVLKADDRRLQTRFGGLNAFVMGVVFAAGWTPCVGPVLGSVLTYTASVSSNPWTGAGYLAVYGLGFAVPLLLTAVFAEGGLRLLNRIKPQLPKIERVLGALLVVVAASMIWDVVASGSLGPRAESRNRQLTTAADGTRLPAMVELYTDDCKICKQMKPVVDRIAKLCNGREVLVRTVNLSRKEHRSLSETYRLVGVPTFLFLDRDGQEVARLIGRQSEGALKQSLSALRGRSCPGVGALPQRGQPAFTKGISNKETSSCRSTNTSVTNATRSSNPSSPSRTATTPIAPPAASALGACSQGLP